MNFVRKTPGMSVVLFEKGHDIENRACPIVAGKGGIHLY